MPADQASCSVVDAEDPNAVGYLRVNDNDHVVIALRDLPRDSDITIDGHEIILRDDIPKGHKIALYDIKEGQEVLKLGFVIGKASRDILAGEHVHSHNMVTTLSGLEDYTYQPAPLSPAPKFDADATFQGYRRADGTVGIRNEIWILCTVGCVARTSDRLAKAAAERFKGRIDGVYALTHPLGCSQLGDDLSHTRKLLASLAMHPNAGGVLIIGLGCENNQLSALIKEIDKPADRLKYFAAQMVDDENDAHSVEGIESIAHSLHAFGLGFEVERRAEHSGRNRAANQRRIAVRRAAERDEVVFLALDAVLFQEEAHHGGGGFGQQRHAEGLAAQVGESGDVRPRQHHESDLVVFGADEFEIGALIDGRHGNFCGDRADVAGAGRYELQALYGRVVIDELQIQSFLFHVAELDSGKHIPVVGRAHHRSAPGDVLFLLGLGQARGEKSQRHGACRHKSLHRIPPGANSGAQ